MNSNLITETKWIEVSGKGETQDKAIEDAFKEMRKKVGTDFKKPIIAIRTSDVILAEVKKYEKEEAFFIFFMKRKRITWDIAVKIKIEIDFVDLKRSDGND